MQQSARVLREIIDQVEGRIGKVRAGGAESPTPRGNAVPSQETGGGRAIPRSAWQSAR